MIKRIIKSNIALRNLVCSIYNLMYNGLAVFHRRGINLSVGKSSLIRKIRITTDGEYNQIVIGNDCRLNKVNLIVSGSHNQIIIGNAVCLNEVVIHTENNHNKISIGNNTTIHGNTDISAIEGTKVLIGEDCMFSRDIYISTGDGHTITDASSNRINPSKDILIGNHVWVGTQTIINKGVRIGNDSIIGAGAVCTGKCNDAGDGVIYAGNPAKVVKSQVNWMRERI